jgi:hypothetical protein
MPSNGAIHTILECLPGLFGRGLLAGRFRVVTSTQVNEGRLSQEGRSAMDEDMPDGLLTAKTKSRARSRAAFPAPSSAQVPSSAEAGRKEPSWRKCGWTRMTTGGLISLFAPFNRGGRSQVAASVQSPNPNPILSLVSSPTSDFAHARHSQQRRHAFAVREAGSLRP